MKRSELVFTLLLIPLDFLALVAAGIAAYYSRFHPYFVKWRPVVFDLRIQDYTEIVIAIALLWILIFAFAGLYSTRRPRIASELSRIILAASTSMAAVFAVLFFSRILFESRFIAMVSWILAIVFVSAVRILIRQLQRSLLRFGIGERRVVIIGTGTTADALTAFLQTHHRLGFHVVAVFEDFSKKTAEKIKRIQKKDGLDELILAQPSATRETALEILEFTGSEHLGFRYSASLFEAATGKSLFATYGGIPVIEVRKTPLDGWGAIYKRGFDIVVSLMLIILTLPIQLVVALALFIEQPGRILFSRLPGGKKASRIGQGGKPFHYFKFRSMIKDAHKYRYDKNYWKEHNLKDMREGTPLLKFEKDPRVTRVGRILRTLSLDELPEFYLVLFGRMSLVGPRPHLPEEVDQYTPFQRRVLTIKPGITGMAQISGRANLDFNDEVRLDIHYIEDWSPWLDLLILFKTPFVVLFRKGAY